MKRTALRRKRPISRGKLKIWPARVRHLAAVPASAPRPRATMALQLDGAQPCPKDEPVRSEPYRRLVAALPCIFCGLERTSQAAHPNTGKGAALKADDRDCFPLCSDIVGRRGCHPRFDQGALFNKERRRELEPLWSNQTRMKLRALAQNDPDIRRVVEKVIGL